MNFVIDCGNSFDEFAVPSDAEGRSLLLASSGGVVERELVAACLQVHALLNAGVSFGIEFATYGVSPPAVVDAASTLLDLASLPARKILADDPSVGSFEVVLAEIAIL